MDIPEKMKAVVFKGKEKVEVQQFNIPKPKYGEVLIKINFCLICTWEQRIFSGESSVKFPFIAGHEASGEIVNINEDTVSNFNLGDHVVFKTLDHCGHCYHCYRGHENQCVGNKKSREIDGVPMSGGLAQYIVLDQTRVFPVDNNVPFSESSFVEPVACTIRSIKRGGIEFGDDVVIIGAGIMGQLHSVLAQKKGARVIVIELDEDRRVLAKKLGAHLVIDPKNKDIVHVVLDETNGKGADVVFNTTTSTEVAGNAIKYMNKRGRMVFYGSFYPNNDINIDPNKIHYSEKIITGSSSASTIDFIQASKMISDGILPVENFITSTFSLEEAHNALVASQSSDTFRVGIKMQ